MSAGGGEVEIYAFSTMRFELLTQEDSIIELRFSDPVWMFVRNDMLPCLFIAKRHQTVVVSFGWQRCSIIDLSFAICTTFS